MAYNSTIDSTCPEFPCTRSASFANYFLDAVSAMDGARVLQLCRARESGSVERLDNLWFCEAKASG